VVGDPLYELNFLNSSAWDAHVWTFSTTFVAPAARGHGSGAGAGASWMLVFDGVKMGSRVLLDGVPVGNTTDQFLRYVFPVTLGAAPGTRHTLEVVFDPAIDCSGRWMACTGGWDWAPYTNTAQGGSPTFTKGIWKSVSLVQVAAGSVAITDVVPQITYAGEYPVEPLADATHGGFDVRVRVHTWAAAPTSGALTVTGAWGGGTRTIPVLVAAGNASTTVRLPTASGVKLWWPSGHGAQPLYNLSVTFTPSRPGGRGGRAATGETAAAGNGRRAGHEDVTAHRRVGFRFFALVTGNDTDPAYVSASKGKDGTVSLGMLWRVNGAVSAPRRHVPPRASGPRLPWRACVRAHAHGLCVPVPVRQRGGDAPDALLVGLHPATGHLCQRRQHDPDG